MKQLNNIISSLLVCTILLGCSKEGPVAVKSVSISIASISFPIGQTYSMSATVLPENATNKNISWSSSNQEVADVDSEGKVTALSIGKTTITVTTEDGDKTSQCMVTVIPKPVESVSFDNSTLDILQGETATLTVSVLPEDAGNRDFELSTDNSDVAVVDSDGTVTAINIGTATITATTKDGGKTAECTVTVKEYMINGHPAVSLFLPSGLRWATCNIGASTSGEVGSLFAWGETETKEAFNEAKYVPWPRSIQKYCTDSYYGNVDNKTVLEPDDDAAHANWGSTWRMPTKEDYNELLDNCNIIDIYAGWKIQSKIYNISIVLPGCGVNNGTDYIFINNEAHYWTSSLYETMPTKSYVFTLSDNIGLDTYSRSGGMAIRPVSE